MFKDKLKENRQKLGLTQEQLAAQIFVSREAVSKWEQGRGLPEKESLERLATLFSMDEKELLSEDDLHEAVDENAAAADKNRRHFFILSLVSSVLVTALSATLIAFAFIYHTSVQSKEATYTLQNVDMERNADQELYINRLDVSNDDGSMSYSADAFAHTLFYNEADTYLEDPFAEVVLREGDVLTLEVSETNNTNLYGSSKEKSIDVKVFHLLSHPFSPDQFLYGVGVKVGSLESTFSETGDNSAFISCTRSSTSNLRSTHSHNASDVSFSYYTNTSSPNRSSVSASFSFVCDRNLIKTPTFEFAFLYGDGSWSSTYIDFSRNITLGANWVILEVGSMRTHYKGISDLEAKEGSYCYDTWTVFVTFASNPSYYHVAFYDESQTLLSAADVHSLQEAQALTLPSTRAYASVSKYGSNGKFLTSSSVNKGTSYCFCFANSEGVFAEEETYVAL
jgi:transcriptional regulator with XRE-family HTH domain